MEEKAHIWRTSPELAAAVMSFTCDILHCNACQQLCES